MEFLQATYLGSDLIQYIIYFSALTGGIIAGKILNYIYKNILQKKAENTDTKIDDIILKTLGTPVLFLGFVVAALLAKPVLTPTAGFAGFLNTATEILVFLSIAWVTLRFIENVIDVYLETYVSKSESKLDDQLVPIVNKMIRITAVALTIIVILDSVGYNVNAIIASLGIGGLAVAFAARETVADVFGGFNILTARPFVVGDRVEINDEADGVVEEIGLRYTRLRDLDGRRITVPNSSVANSVITNISSEPSRRIIAELGLVYETTTQEMKQAIEILVETVNGIEGIDSDSTEARFWEFADSSMNIRLMYFITDSDWRSKVSEVNSAVQDAFEENELEMAFPTREIRMKE